LPCEPHGGRREEQHKESDLKRSPFVLIALLVGALLALGQYIPGSGASAAAADRFHPSAPDKFAGEKDALGTPVDYEQQAAANPTPLGALFSQCRFAPFAGATNLYAPYAGTSTADSIVGDTTFQLAGNTTCYNPQNEANIVVNPKNSQYVVTSGNEYRFDGHSIARSADGGKTFTDVALPGFTGATGGIGKFSSMSSCGDPVLAYDPDGSTLYYSGLVCSFQGSSSQSGLAVASSKDNGLHWSAPSLATIVNPQKFFTDKEWITVGADHTVYVTWTDFVAPANTNGNGYQSSNIFMASSKDGGVSWSSPVQVSDSAHPFDQGSQVATSPDGKTLYVAYEGASPSTGYNTDALVFARSTNGGQSFSTQEVARIYDDNNCYPIQLPGAQDRQTLSGEQFRINSYPSMAVDPTNGRIAITWADDQANKSCGGSGSFSGTTSNQVKLVTSADGSSFSSVQTITGGSADKVYPAVGANDGRIVIGYYTRAYSPKSDLCKAAVLNSDGSITLFGGPVCLDYASRSSTNGFGKEIRLSTQSSNPYLQFAGSFIGDYTGVAVDGTGAAWAAAVDDRGNPGLTWPNQDQVVFRGF
jgi:hypothetical protein